MPLTWLGYRMAMAFVLGAFSHLLNLKKASHVVRGTHHSPVALKNQILPATVWVSPESDPPPLSFHPRPELPPTHGQKPPKRPGARGIEQAAPRFLTPRNYEIILFSFKPLIFGILCDTATDELRTVFIHFHPSEFFSSHHFLLPALSLSWPFPHSFSFSFSCGTI